MTSRKLLEIITNYKDNTLTNKQIHKSNIIRICGHSRYVYLYWLETMCPNYHTFSYNQLACIDGVKKGMALWLITTSGYFDKSVKGNWASWNTWIQPTDMPSGKIEYIDANEVINSECFKKFYKLLFEIVERRSNPTVILMCLVDVLVETDLFTQERELFKQYMYPNIDTFSRDNLGYLDNMTINELFTKYANKNVVIINLYADLIRDHYNSGKVRDWYIKHLELNYDCDVPCFNNVSSIEIPYPFGNGMNETECNDFFEMLDKIKLKIDNHSEPYDLAIISAGIYTSFIADYIDKTKGKEFTCYGRELNHIFCIKYKNTYRWCHCEFTKTHLEEYLCPIPDKYRLTGFQGVEEGGYW